MLPSESSDPRSSIRAISRFFLVPQVSEPTRVHWTVKAFGVYTKEMRYVTDQVGTDNEANSRPVYYFNKMRSKAPLTAVRLVNTPIVEDWLVLTRRLLPAVTQRFLGIVLPQPLFGCETKARIAISAFA